MARSSSGRAKPDGMRRKTKAERLEEMSPRRRGNRLKEELKKADINKRGQSHRKRT